MKRIFNVPIFLYGMSRRQHSSLHKKHSIGFSMIELLIALAIIGLMMLFLLVTQGLQLSRGEDAVRKSDLSRIKIVFEDYYNDHGCYPPPELLNNCNSGDLQPYLPRIPCDPRTQEPYSYYKDEQCKWYAVFTHLEDEKDQAITNLQCSPNCGIEDQSLNYFVSNSAYTIPDLIDAVNTQTNYTPGSGAGNFACDQTGICNSYADPASHGCPVTFSDATECQNACSDPANRCTR